MNGACVLYVINMRARLYYISRWVVCRTSMVIYIISGTFY
ncbi:hypothetical protein M088_6110 [Bacteroides ovatus str. 3725 D1 iv]|nr:hypothetical protein M088_6110 [Bacteroides ovatus str. 3725 D1 iv]